MEKFFADTCYNETIKKGREKGREKEGKRGREKEKSNEVTLVDADKKSWRFCE